MNTNVVMHNPPVEATMNVNGDTLDCTVGSTISFHDDDGVEHKFDSVVKKGEGPMSVCYIIIDYETRDFLVKIEAINLGILQVSSQEELMPVLEQGIKELVWDYRESFIARDFSSVVTGDD